MLTEISGQVDDLPGLSDCTGWCTLSVHWDRHQCLLLHCFLRNQKRQSFQLGSAENTTEKESFNTFFCTPLVQQPTLCCLFISFSLDEHKEKVYFVAHLGTSSFPSSLDRLKNSEIQFKSMRGHTYTNSSTHTYGSKWKATQIKTLINNYIKKRKSYHKLKITN